VHTDTAEVGLEAGLHVGAHRGLKGLAGGGKHPVHDGRRGDRARFVCGFAAQRWRRRGWRLAGAGCAHRLGRGAVGFGFEGVVGGANGKLALKG